MFVGVLGCASGRQAASLISRSRSDYAPCPRILFQGDSITDGNRGRNEDPNHISGHRYVDSSNRNFTAWSNVHEDKTGLRNALSNHSDAINRHPYRTLKSNRTNLSYSTSQKLAACLKVKVTVILIVMLNDNEKEELKRIINKYVEEGRCVRPIHPDEVMLEVNRFKMTEGGVEEAEID